jgi:hypothetical protein
MITMTITVIEAGYANGSTTHANLFIRVETVATPVLPDAESNRSRFWVVLNPHTTRHEILCVVMGREVVVCSHITTQLAYMCIAGEGCAYGTPVGKYP